MEGDDGGVAIKFVNKKNTALTGASSFSMVIIIIDTFKNPFDLI